MLTNKGVVVVAGAASIPAAELFADVVSFSFAGPLGSVFIVVVNRLVVVSVNVGVDGFSIAGSAYSAGIAR